MKHLLIQHTDGSAVVHYHSPLCGEIALCGREDIGTPDVVETTLLVDCRKCLTIVRAALSVPVEEL